MAFLQIPTYSIKQFSWSKKERAMIADASDLSRGNIASRIYDDACDVGFAIQSEKTGVVIKFYLAEECRDPSGEEVTHWVYLSLGAGLNCKVVVLND